MMATYDAAFQSLQASEPRCKFEKKCNRRGKFNALNAGISFGNGQKVYASPLPHYSINAVARSPVICATTLQTSESSIASSTFAASSRSLASRRKYSQLGLQSYILTMKKTSMPYSPTTPAFDEISAIASGPPLRSTLVPGPLRLNTEILPTSRVGGVA